MTVATSASAYKYHLVHMNAKSPKVDRTNLNMGNGEFECLNYRNTIGASERAKRVVRSL